MGAQSVKIPIELELGALGGSIKDLEKALDKVKPGTKIYNSLSQQLDRLKADFLSLQVSADKSYSKIGDVHNFEKKFGKVADEIQILARNLSSLEFENLNFEVADLDEVKKLEDSVASVKKEITTTKLDAFKNIFASSSDLQETFKDLQLNINVDSAEQAIEKIKQKIDDLKVEKEDITREDLINKGELNDLEKKITDLKNFKKLITDLDDPTFFKKNKTFKNKESFVKEWSERLGLDEESLEALVADGAKNMANAYQKIEDEVNKKSKSAVARRGKLRKKATDDALKLSLNEQKTNLYSSSLKQLQDAGIDPALVAELDKLQTKLQTAETELINFKKLLVSLVGPSDSAEDVLKKISEAMGKLPSKTNAATEQLEAFTELSRKISNMQSIVRQWFGFNEVINLTKRTVRGAVEHIRDLDKVMTEIAVVTDMDQDDLWQQIDTYSKIAQEYGVSTVGVYEVSQLYYQQGLGMTETMQLTEETLKMAKIAGIDYSDATDYMTVAIRGFKMEMSDAQNVVDVYSNIAAITASDTEELAVAMSKTASSAEAVGSSFEHTTAMIALMVETTREAPQKIYGAYKKML